MKSFKHTNWKWIASFFVIMVLAWSCQRESDLPDEPVINSVTFDRPSEHLIVEFTDGDGDFGFPDSDETEQWLDEDETDLNPYYNNLWIDYFEKRDGEWVMVEPANILGFNFRVPELTPKGQSKQLEVKITNDMSFDLPLATAESDTIKFSVTLVDRARHESIPMETDPIVYAE